MCRKCKKVHEFKSKYILPSQNSLTKTSEIFSHFLVLQKNFEWRHSNAVFRAYSSDPCFNYCNCKVKAHWKEPSSSVRIRTISWKAETDAHITSFILSKN